MTLDYMFLKNAFQVRKQGHFTCWKDLPLTKKIFLKMRIYVNICNDENDEINEKK